MMGASNSRKCIIVVEPQCAGFEHSSYNAALLATICYAFPADKVLFWGEQNHLGYVRDVLDRILGEDRIDFREVRIPARESSNWRRFPSEYSLCKQVLAKAQCEGSRALIFCSVTNTSLLVLKLLMQIKHSNLPTVAVVHGCLSSITGRQARRPWNWLIELKHVLTLPHPHNLRLLALGDSILDNVKKMLPKCGSQWRPLNLACLWPSHDNQKKNQQAFEIEYPVRLGFVGVSSKGFDIFCRLAQDIAPQNDVAQFMLVGFYNGPADKKPCCQYISRIPEHPLSREEFEAGMNKLSYIVWTARPDHYRLTASATFLDALAFLKPGIYMRNEYIEHYFNILGDIGYLCDSYEEMVLTIRKIIAEFPLERYRKQVENIRDGRYIFEPVTLAPRLRQIVDDCVV